MFHGFLSRDGCAPDAFRQEAREQLHRYETVAFRDTQVLALERDGTQFLARLRDGDSVKAQKVLLTTGIADELPALVNLDRFYGASVHVCPLCDAWECRGKSIGVLGGDETAAGLALELRQWSEDVTLFAQSSPSWPSLSGERLQNACVKVVETPISSLEGEGSQLSSVRLIDGNDHRCDALFFLPAQRQRCELAETLGCERCEADGCVKCGEEMESSVPGLYAAGNASPGVQMAIVAAAEGARAALAINNALTEAAFQDAS